MCHGKDIHPASFAHYDVGPQKISPFSIFFQLAKNFRYIPNNTREEESIGEIVYGTGITLFFEIVHKSNIQQLEFHFLFIDSLKVASPCYYLILIVLDAIMEFQLQQNFYTNVK